MTRLLIGGILGGIVAMFASIGISLLAHPSQTVGILIGICLGYVFTIAGIIIADQTG